MKFLIIHKQVKREVELLELLLLQPSLASLAPAVSGVEYIIGLPSRIDREAQASTTDRLSDKREERIDLTKRERLTYTLD